MHVALTRRDQTLVRLPSASGEPAMQAYAHLIRAVRFVRGSSAWPELTCIRNRMR
jgi:hypothetical protein